MLKDFTHQFDMKKKFLIHKKERHSDSIDLTSKNFFFNNHIIFLGCKDWKNSEERLFKMLRLGH